MNNIAKKILDKIIEMGYEAYIVGGYVRDKLLGKNSNDIDIVTNATIKELLTVFSGNVNDCGSLNIKTSEVNIDITTYRIESSYCKRKPTKIIYTNNLKDDLIRRDFTINTICMDQNERILDYLNGINDLNAKVIKMVGDTSIKIKEDPLRILRAIRFATILDFKIDECLDREITKNAYLVKELSAYRVKEEISQILISDNYQNGLDLLKKYKMDQYLVINYQHLVYTKDLCGMWAQMNYPESFPFTKIEKNNILKIRNILDFGIINNETIYKYGLYTATIAGGILGISVDSIHDMYQNMPIYLRKDLKITYLEIAEILEMEPSEKVKKIEEDIILEVLNGRVDNTLENLKEYLINNRGKWEINE